MNYIGEILAHCMCFTCYLRTIILLFYGVVYKCSILNGFKQSSAFYISTDSLLSLTTNCLQMHAEISNFTFFFYFGYLFSFIHFYLNIFCYNALRCLCIYEVYFFFEVLLCHHVLPFLYPWIL